MSEIPAAIESACGSAGLSERDLAETAGVSAATLSRILSGDRQAKMTEILLIADSTGCTVALLTGNPAAHPAQCPERATDGAGTDVMRQCLLHYLKLDSYLDH